MTESTIWDEPAFGMDGILDEPMMAGMAGQGVFWHLTAYTAAMLLLRASYQKEI